MVRVREATYTRSAVIAAKYFILNVYGREVFFSLCENKKDTEHENLKEPTEERCLYLYFYLIITILSISRPMYSHHGASIRQSVRPVRDYSSLTRQLSPQNPPSFDRALAFSASHTPTGAFRPFLHPGDMANRFPKCILVCEIASSAGHFPSPVGHSSAFLMPQVVFARGDFSEPLMPLS
jgi:hypothetical protein